MSIDYLEVDLAGCFAAGHAYVALSRARSHETLRVRSFDAKVVFADPRVAKFTRRRVKPVTEGVMCRRGGGTGADGGYGLIPRHRRGTWDVYERFDDLLNSCAVRVVRLVFV